MSLLIFVAAWMSLGAVVGWIVCRPDLDHLDSPTRR